MPNNAKDDVALCALGLLLLGNNSSRLSRELNEIYALGDFDMQKVGLKKTDTKAIIYQVVTQGGDDFKTLEKFFEAVK